jgi:hypothetical protein
LHRPVRGILSVARFAIQVAWMSEIVIVFIYGAIAGLMGSVIISMQVMRSCH